MTRFSLQTSRRQRSRYRHIAGLLLAILLFQNFLPLLGHGVAAASPAFTVADEPGDEFRTALCGMPLNWMKFTAGSTLALSAGAAADDDANSNGLIQVMGSCPACMLYHLLTLSLPGVSSLGPLGSEDHHPVLTPYNAVVHEARTVRGLAIRAPPVS